MNLNSISEAKNARPFKPFTIALVDGRRIEVRHPDFVAISPNRRHAIAYHPDGSWSELEPLLILSLEHPAPSTAQGATPPSA